MEIEWGGETVDWSGSPLRDGRADYPTLPDGYAIEKLEVRNGRLIAFAHGIWHIVPAALKEQEKVG